MYEEFFQLAEMPFNNTPDPRFFYQTVQHEEALATLLFTVHERKGYALLTGEVGAGKTLVAREMLRKLDGSIESANIINSFLTPRELLVRIAYEFCLPHDPMASSAELGQTIQSFLLERFVQNIPVVVIIDEAQNLSDDTLEQIRMIGNLESDHSKLIQIIVMGQPEFRDRLSSARLRPLEQRIFQAFHLSAMSLEETACYIGHRLRVAGASRVELFHDQAVQLIHQQSGGVPRIINHLCDHALLAAYIAETNVVTVETIARVIRESRPGLVGRPQTALNDSANRHSNAASTSEVNVPLDGGETVKRITKCIDTPHSSRSSGPREQAHREQNRDILPPSSNFTTGAQAGQAGRHRRIKDIIEEVRNYTERNIRATYQSGGVRSRENSWKQLADETESSSPGNDSDATHELMHRLRDLTQKFSGSSPVAV
jgi:general secretion pathway protein A